MKANPFFSAQINRVFTLLIIALFISGNILGSTFLKKQDQNDTLSYKLVKGTIMDSDNGSPLIFANLTVEDTNIATVSNSEGDFSLKIPKEMLNKKLTVSYIGYKSKMVDIKDLKGDKNKIKLELLTVSLDAINVFPKDPYLLIQAVIQRRNENYIQEESLMTAFYRETIKNRRQYASLSEAVVEVYKHSYGNDRQDVIRLMKGRKSADYSKLDTLVFKLQGGPYSTIMLDIMKNPYMILDYDVLEDYTFSIANITREDNRLLYVLEFAQREWVQEPLFYGKLYIDAESLAIVNATYNINTEDQAAVARMFIKRKPAGAQVYPTEASYMVSYREKDGKWIYGYSRGELTFKVKWNKRLFNSVYHTGIEMAVTDWKATNEKPFKSSDRMKMNIVMTDAQLGFADDNFWGKYNVIEPEKSIETAIKKIQKNLDKLEH
ncbi:carboxypeptidase-like regulatory domain-containing protein [Carboxylicivirga caseinilyticus]|uniref:carboxypeptidase-like regulatory domain-containing protein n=1 Tax=Carboxylicivirga caseinilyticus TaxID=3417572 RepID=UPI003D34498B|nr:carboxypeptidase-like regulatory domain-containing protein [Marinilabiliaceae bacterium A049]